MSKKKSKRKAAKQMTLDLPELTYQGIQYEYAVLVTSLTDEVRTIAQHSLASKLAVRPDLPH